MGESAYRVIAVCRRYVSLALEAADFSQVKSLAIDETSRSRGHDYMTLAADAIERRVLSVSEGRDATTIKTIAAELAAHGCPPEQIESVSIDMSPAFIKGCTEELPSARGLRWTLLKDRAALKPEAAADLDALIARMTRVRTARAWVTRVMRSKVEPVKDVAALVRLFCLYLILDVYSRKIVGFEVHDSDAADHAAHLLKRTALAEGIHAMLTKPVLARGTTARRSKATVLAMLQWLGVEPSCSRPRVSDDNAYVESLFRTAKYRPEFPHKGFADVSEARAWAADFVHWYNHEHLHSGIRYVSPAQRHAGDDQAILAARHELYLQARARNPRRWSGTTRNWTPIGMVTLNPERDSVVLAWLKAVGM